MEKLTDRIKRSPIVAAVGLFVAALITLGGLWALLFTEPMLRTLWDAASGRPVTAVRIVASIALLAMLAGSMGSLIYIIRLVRAIPNDLRRACAEQTKELTQLRQDRDALQTSNSAMAQEREGRRGWESERSTALAKNEELRAELGRLQTERLSSDEKDAITKLRTTWKMRGGVESFSAMDDLVNHVIEEIRHKPHVEMLLKSVREVLRTRAEAFDRALGIEQQTQLESLLESFNTYFKQYRLTAEHLYSIHQSGDLDLIVAGRGSRLAHARAAYAKFRREIEECSEYPGLNAKLLIFQRFPGLAASKFLGSEPWEGKPPPTVASDTNDA